MPVIGYVGLTSPGPAASIVTAIRQGLGDTGYVEGQNVLIEYRWAEGHYDRLPALFAELVAAKVDVIVAGGGATGADRPPLKWSTLSYGFCFKEDRNAEKELQAGRDRRQVAAG